MQDGELPEEVPAIDLQEQDHATSTNTERGSDESESDPYFFEFDPPSTDTESESDSDESEFLESEGRNNGEESNGIGRFSENKISRCLNPYTFHSANNKNGIDLCVICQFKYEEGEALAALIQCEHPYHRECIIKWLRMRKVCPICRRGVSRTPR